MDFHCSSCECYFVRKQNYERHLLSKKHNRREIIRVPLYKCSNCERIFSYASGLSKHKEKCKLKSDFESMKKQLEYQQLKFEKEREFMIEQIEKLIDKSYSNTINNNIESQHIDTQNNITIHINAFGKENTDYLTKKTILKCIDRVYKSIPCLIAKIHFDPEHPENHNIKITNKKLPYASIMGENRKWKTVDRKDIIDTMVDNGYTILDDTYKDNKTCLKDNRQNHFKGFQEKFESSDKELMKKIKTDVELLVLNASY